MFARITTTMIFLMLVMHGSATATPDEEICTEETQGHIVLFDHIVDHNSPLTCVVIDNGGTVTFHNGDTWGHDYGSTSDNGECFRFSDHHGGRFMRTGESWAVTFTWDGGDDYTVSLEAEDSDTGEPRTVTRTCVAGLEGRSTEGQLEILFQCWVPSHSDQFTGKIIVKA